MVVDYPDAEIGILGTSWGGNFVVLAHWLCSWTMKLVECFSEVPR